MRYLVSFGDQSRVPLRQDALHPEDKRAFEFDFTPRVRRRETEPGEVRRALGQVQNGLHLVVIVPVDVLEDAVPCQLHLHASRHSVSVFRVDE